MNLDLRHVILVAVLVTTSGLDFCHQGREDSYVNGWLCFRYLAGWKRRHRSASNTDTWMWNLISSKIMTLLHRELSGVPVMCEETVYNSTGSNPRARNENAFSAKPDFVLLRDLPLTAS